MAGERDVGEETRNKMMQNLFGEQSEEEEEGEEEEEEVNSFRQPGFQSEGEGEAELDGDDEGEIESQGEIEVESEAEAHSVDLDQGESEGERVQSSERVRSQQKMDSMLEYLESGDEGYGQRVVTSRRREIMANEPDASEESKYADHEVGDNYAESNKRANSRLVNQQQDDEVVRDVFGDSDEDEPVGYGAQDEIEQDTYRYQEEEGVGYENDLRPGDIVPDEDVQYISEDEHLQKKSKEKPVGPPLDLEIPLHSPPGQPDRMNIIKVSNIMGIESKPFDPKTYVEEDVFMTDESGTKKPIRLEDNIVRWRTVKNSDGTISYESNARIVRWKDGSLQLLIGNEVLDMSVHDAQYDQSHLFLRHGKGVLQSQGRLLQKMRFMPSSLSSKSHRLLTALVDSRHKKVYKVKNCITDIDPEREKEQKERVEGQTIRANEVLHRKREKVNRKYTQTMHRGRQLSPGFLEDALDEEDEPEDYYNSRRARNHFEEDLEAEAKAEKRILNAKKSNAYTSIQQKASVSAARSARRPLEEYSESEKEEESEYETDGEDVNGSPPQEGEDEYDEEEEEARVKSASEEDEDEVPRRKSKETGISNLKRKFDSDEGSPPRKMTAHRRKAMVFDSDED